MTEPQWRAFVLEGTRTGKLAATRKDGRPHVVPIWFSLDDDGVVFKTHAETIKGRALRREAAPRCASTTSARRSPMRLRRPRHDLEDLAAVRRYATAIGGATWAPSGPRSSAAQRRGRRAARPARAEHVFAEAGVADD